MASKKYYGLPKLKVSKSHGTYQYHVGNQYISKSKTDYLCQLVKKEYYEKLLPNLEMYVKKCEELLEITDRTALDHVYFELCKGKQILLNDVLYLPATEQAKLFELEKYDEQDLPYEITTEIYTVKGEHVRSKSEKIIADELYRRGIPYRYEKPLVLYDKNRRIVIHPDFTTINTITGKKMYIEHLGMLSNPDYINSSIKKIGLYERNGLLLGRDVILFHESSEEPLNMQILNQYLDEFF